MKTSLLAYLAIITFIINYHQSQAQGTFNNRFKFKDGIYLSSEEYFSNSPSITFDEANLPVAKYGKFNESQFQNIRYVGANGEEVKLNVRQIWGVSVKGVPYIFCGFSVANETDLSFLTNTIKRSRNLVFNEIMYVGNISLYTFKHEQWMIKSNTTKSERITLKNIRKMIKDDQELLNEFRAERNKRKHKHGYLVQYNKRHPLNLHQVAHRN